QNLVLKNGDVPLNSPITYISPGAAPGTSLSTDLVSNAGRYNLNLSPGTGGSGLRSSFGAAPTTKSGFATLRQSLVADVQAFAEFSLNENTGEMKNNPFASRSITVS